MKKLLSLIGGASLVGASTLSVISCGQPAVLWQELKDVRKFIEFTNLGTFGSVPNEDAILTKFGNLNNKVNQREMEVKKIDLTNKTATISVKPRSKVYYFDSIEVRYDYSKELIALTDDLKNTDLGTLKIESLNAINLLGILAGLEGNENLKTGQLTVVNIRQNQAVIMVGIGSNIYKSGSINVHYNLEKSFVLKEVTTAEQLVTELGHLTLAGIMPTDDSIIKSFITANIYLGTYLVAGDLKVISKSLTQATLQIEEGSTSIFIGTVNVTYE